MTSPNVKLFKSGKEDPNDGFSMLRDKHCQTDHKMISKDVSTEVFELIPLVT